MASSIEPPTKLHIAFFPLMAHGHLPPMLDMAKLFTSRGLKTTIIATSAFAGPIQESGHEDVGLTMVDFPPKGSSLPPHIVSLDQAITYPALISMFTEALALLQQPVERLLQEELSPNCLVSDMFLPWTAASASKLGIPRLSFHGTSCFALYVSEQMSRQQPYKNVSSDFEPFTLNYLPHEVKFLRTELSPFELFEIDDPHFQDFKKLMERVREAEDRSYGVVMNSFYELESAYIDSYKKVLGRKAWHVGPLLLCSSKGDEKADKEEREKSNEGLIAWLDSKGPNSVVYVCFGSLSTFTPAQMRETAAGLESSGQDFIWVVRESPGGGEGGDFLPDGVFEERVKGKGLVIRGWAPQKMILDHPSVGAFVTHCGWNSILESICAGVPIAAWPLAAEQFFNAKLVTDVLKIGVAVGGTKWQNNPCEGVPRAAVAEAVGRVMGAGGEVAEIRARAGCFKEAARRAVREGGSSYDSLSQLINELTSYGPLKKLDLI